MIDLHTELFRRAVQDMLSYNEIVYIVIDPRKDDVIVPTAYKDDDMLILQLSYDQKGPSLDLECGEEGLSSTMLFHNVPFSVFVPWTAVFACYPMLPEPPSKPESKLRLVH